MATRGAALAPPVPQLHTLHRLVLSSVASVHSRRAYGRAIDDFLAWYAAEPRGAFSKALVQEYRSRLEAQGSPPRSGARVRGRQLGFRARNWLTLEHAPLLIAAPDPQTLKAQRDRAMLIAAGCGARLGGVILDLQRDTFA